MQNYQALRFETDGHLVKIVLNRPDSLNAIDDEMHYELLEALLHVRGATDVRAILLASTGKAFSAGGGSCRDHAAAG